jgi:hypothetical protein
LSLRLQTFFMLFDTNAYKMLFSAENQTKVLLHQTTITSLFNSNGTPRKTHKTCKCYFDGNFSF